MTFLQIPNILKETVERVHGKKGRERAHEPTFTPDQYSLLRRWQRSVLVIGGCPENSRGPFRDARWLRILTDARWQFARVLRWRYRWWVCRLVQNTLFMFRSEDLCYPAPQIGESWYQEPKPPEPACGCEHVN